MESMNMPAGKKTKLYIFEDKFLPVEGHKKAHSMGFGKLMAPYEWESERELQVFWLNVFER